MVKVYSQLDGFPKPGEQPEYYRMLANVGELTKRPGTEIVVAEFNSKIIGAVVFFSDMQYYDQEVLQRQKKMVPDSGCWPLTPMPEGWVQEENLQRSASGVQRS